ncbi:hypothetical protein [Streptomyces sp. NPDC058305]|uniref:hypothetical protein n=1 Tax=Streptomyces sp. NPDC058305 TaxID=3346438 RepID=UPI0036E4787B
MTHKDTLVAVSDAHQEDIPAGKTEKFTYHLAPIRTVTSAVTPDRKGDEVNAQAAVASLESATGLELAKAGTTFTLGPGERELSTSSGRSSGVMVAVVSIDTVEAPFSYGCSNDEEKSVRGTLATWQPGPYSSLFKCGIKETLPRPEAEAEALMCGQVNSK